MFFDFEFPLLLVAILLIRFFVWRGRYRGINQKLTDISGRVSELNAEMDKIATKLQAIAVRNARETSPTAAGRASEGIADDTLVAEPAPPMAPEEVSAPSFSTTSAALVDVPEGEPALPPEAFAAQKTPHPFMPRIAPVAPSPRPSPIAALRARIERAGGGAEIEALVGGNWLNKVGVGALVIGMVLFIRYALAYVGPLGKVGLGVGLGLALLVGGVLLERRQRYTLFARPLIGGGWALLYFTAYAAHNFDAARVLDDPVLGLVAMIVVAAGMIFHSLRYRAEMVTGVAYVLAFLAIDISPLGLYSLIAATLLAASLVVLLWRFAWYRLALGAVIATYLTHILWMIGATPIIPLPPQAFWVTEAMLILYWLTFAACDFLRKPENAPQRQLALATTVLNTIAFAAISKTLVESAFPRDQHLLAAAIAIVAVAAAALLTRRGRTEPYRFYGLLAGAAGAVAMFVTVHEWSIAGEWLAIAWGVLAAVILAIGLGQREVLFRAEAYAVGAMAAGAVAMIGIFDVAGPTVTSGGSLVLRWVTVISAAVALLIGEWTLARFRDRLVEGETIVATLAGYAAAGLVAALIFRDADAAYLGIVWVVVGAVAAEIGLRIGHVHSRYRGYALMLAGFAAMIVNNSNLVWSQPMRCGRPIAGWCSLPPWSSSLGRPGASKHRPRASRPRRLHWPRSAFISALCSSPSSHGMSCRPPP